MPVRSFFMPAVEKKVGREAWGWRSPRHMPFRQKEGTVYVLPLREGVPGGRRVPVREASRPRCCHQRVAQFLSFSELSAVFRRKSGCCPP